MRVLPAVALTIALAACVPTASESDPSAGGPASLPRTNDPSIVQPPVGAGTGKTWRLAHSDDFTGSTLDLSKWTPCFSWASTYSACTSSFNNGRETYSPSQVELSGGAAHLVARPNPSAGAGKYLSGLLSTTNPPRSSGQPGSIFTFTYGYAEARMRVPSERGFFTAFWMLPATGSPYNYPYEIDILEALGGSDEAAHMTVHFDGRSEWFSPNESAENGACPSFDYSDGYHTYGIDWQPGHIAWYIDGKECGRFTGEVWAGDMELILNLMVDVDWQRNVGQGLRDSNATASLDVDYIKVWQRV